MSKRLCAILPRSRSRRIALALACVALAFAVSWVVHFTWGGNLHCVVPGRVYRSGQPSPAMLADVQKRLGVRSVINLRGEYTLDAWYQDEKRAARELGLQHFDVLFRTHQLAPKHQLRKLIAALDDCPKPVLIHCRQGADRASLASAIYMLLYEGQTPEEAMSQYALVYGHVIIAHGWRLPHLFDCYRDWLSEQNTSHSPAEFRRWVHSGDGVGYFGASIAAAPVQSAVAGRDSLVFQVQNTSQYPWTFSDPANDAIHLCVRFTHSAHNEQIFVKTPGPRGTVQPGQTVQFEALVPAKLTEPGTYGIFADLQDHYGFFFSDMAGGGCPGNLVVTHTPLESDPLRAAESRGDMARGESGSLRR